MRQNMTDLVKSILLENKDARNSDRYLYYLVCMKKFPQVTLGMVSLESYLLDKMIYDTFPDFASVSRCRRKVQELYPQLRADKEVADFREYKEQEYKDYAKRRIL